MTKYDKIWAKLRLFNVVVNYKTNYKSNLFRKYIFCNSYDLKLNVLI